MVLTTGINHLDDGFVCNTLNQPINFPGTLKGATRINENDPFGCNNESECCIIPQILCRTIPKVTDNCIYVRSYFLQF